MIMGQSGARSDPARAPEPLAVVQDFLNSLHIERGTDELTDPARALRWLRQIGLLPPPVGSASLTLSSHELEVLVALRVALRDLVSTRTTTTHRARAAEQLAGLANASRYEIRTDAVGSIRFEPVGTPVERLLGTIVSFVHDAQRDHTWERLKICRSDACAWVFYDQSRNHSATWCAMGVCGNRQKVSRHRQRQRAADA